MNNQNKINYYRRNIMRGLTRNVGTTLLDVKPGTKADFKRILIIRPNNRLGNLLLMTPLIQEVSDVFPDCKIDLFVRGNLASKLFKYYTQVDKIIKLPGKPFKHLLDYAAAWLSVKKEQYDLVINLVPNSSSGRLSTRFSRATYKIFGDVNKNSKNNCSDYEHVAQYPVCNFREFLSLFGIHRHDKPMPCLNLKLTDGELKEGKQLVDNLTGGTKPIISIFTYATGQKCYSVQWWETFYERLVKEFDSYHIVEVLPAENVSQINFKATTFYSMDIRQLGAFIANTSIFIGADSGIMHLASAVGTPTMGLFSCTNPASFKPYNSHSTAIDTNYTGIDSWVGSIKDVLLKLNK